MPTEAERLVGYLIGRLLAMEKERDLFAQRVQQLEAERDGPEPPPAALHPLPQPQQVA